MGYTIRLSRGSCCFGVEVSSHSFFCSSIVATKEEFSRVVGAIGLLGAETGRGKTLLAVRGVAPLSGDWDVRKNAA